MTFFLPFFEKNGIFEKIKNDACEEFEKIV